MFTSNNDVVIILMVFKHREYIMKTIPESSGFVFTKVTRRVSLVEQELSTLPEYLNLPQVVSGVVQLLCYLCHITSLVSSNFT